MVLTERDFSGKSPEMELDNISTLGTNIFLGLAAGNATVKDDGNMFLGYYAGADNVDGSRNIFMGQSSGEKSKSTTDNIFIGDHSGYNNITGVENVFVGTNTGYNNTSGSQNTYVGYEAGYNSKTSKNTLIGYKAGYNNKGNNCTFIGYRVGYNNTQPGQMKIGTGLTEVDPPQNQVARVGPPGPPGPMGPMGPPGDLRLEDLQMPTGTTTETTTGTIIGTTGGGGFNTAVGEGDTGNALFAQGSSGQFNSLFGFGIAPKLTGSTNLILGSTSGQNLTNASGNILLGNNLHNEESEATISNKIHIGNKSAGRINYGSINIGHNIVSPKGIAVGHNTGDTGDITGLNLGNTIIKQNINTSLLLGSSIIELGADNLIASVGNDMKIVQGRANTVIGKAKGLTGNYTTAIGHIGQIRGDYNLFMGYNTGSGIQTSESHSNILLGTSAGVNAYKLSKNILIGDYAAAATVGNKKNDSKEYNIILGNGSFSNIVSAKTNIAIGNEIGADTGVPSHYTGIDSNVLIGTRIAKKTSYLTDNIAIGNDIASNATDVQNNIMIGSRIALKVNDISNNICIGDDSLTYNRHLEDQDVFYKRYNIAIGNRNLTNVYPLSNNIILGNDCGNSLQSDSNIFIGNNVGKFNRGDVDYIGNNIFIGEEAGERVQTVSRSIFIGKQAGQTSMHTHDCIFIGYRAGAGTNDRNQVHGTMTFGGTTFTNGNTPTNNVFIGKQAGESNNWSKDNVAIGQYAAQNASNGDANIFIGKESGKYAFSGCNNTFIGKQSGYCNQYGVDNMFLGVNTGWSNAGGSSNIFIGNESGYSNLHGKENVFVGYRSGYYNSNGEENVFIGKDTGYSNVLGRCNVFLGYRSGYRNSNGEENVFVGKDTGYSNTIGIGNVFLGNAAGFSNYNGVDNVFIGKETGYHNTEGNSNVFIGTRAGESNNSGHQNVFVGHGSGFDNKDGDENVFIGYCSGYSNREGDSNVFIGSYAGNSNDTGHNNISIGTYAGYAIKDGQSNVCIGTKAGFALCNAYGNVLIGTDAGSNLGNANSTNTSAYNNTVIGFRSGVYEPMRLITMNEATLLSTPIPSSRLGALRMQNFISSADENRVARRTSGRGGELRIQNFVTSNDKNQANTIFKNRLIYKFVFFRSSSFKSSFQIVDLIQYPQTREITTHANGTPSDIDPSYLGHFLQLDYNPRKVYKYRVYRCDAFNGETKFKRSKLEYKKSNVKEYANFISSLSSISIETDPWDAGRFYDMGHIYSDYDFNKYWEDIPSIFFGITKVDNKTDSDQFGKITLSFDFSLGEIASFQARFKLQHKYMDKITIHFNDTIPNIGDIIYGKDNGKSAKILSITFEAIENGAYPGKWHISLDTEDIFYVGEVIRNSTGSKFWNIIEVEYRFREDFEFVEEIFEDKSPILDSYFVHAKRGIAFACHPPTHTSHPVTITLTFKKQPHSLSVGKYYPLNTLIFDATHISQKRIFVASPSHDGLTIKRFYLADYPEGHSMDHKNFQNYNLINTNPTDNQYNVIPKTRVI